MDIKLNARLSAYSKVASIESQSITAEKIPTEQIDELFTGLPQPEFVTKSEIDTLFNREEHDEQADVVSFSKIDSLFR